MVISKTLNNDRFTAWVLSKNDLRIALERSVKLLENFVLSFEATKQKLVLSKNGLRIAVRRFVRFLEKMFLRPGKKSGYFPKMVLEYC
jgi:hypothetical protein